jgi:hypothetical protein
MSVESEMKTLVEEKFDNHESEMKQLGRLLREKVDGWRNWRSERGWGNQAPNTAQSTTKTCWQCQTEIDRRARVCPHCRGKQTSNERKAVLWVVCIIGVLMAIGSGSNGGKSSSTSSTKPVQTQTEYRYPYGVSPTIHDKGVAAILFYNSECTMTPAVPPMVVRYANLHAQSRIDEVKAVLAEAEHTVTSNGLQRSVGVKFWCTYMWDAMGKEWSQFR